MASERIANMSSFSGSKLRLLLKNLKVLFRRNNVAFNSRPLLSMVSPLLLADQVSVLSWFDWVSSPAVSRPVDRGGFGHFAGNGRNPALPHNKAGSEVYRKEEKGG